MNIRSHTFEEFAERARAFHGFAAPGIMIGGFMVDLAYQHLPPEGLFDALCETPKCLPDAIQLLTPCTAGNGWLQVVNTGRYALALYEKSTGVGIRVFVDPAKLDTWPEIKGWFFRLKAKKEQNYALFMEQIKKAGTDLLGFQDVKIADRFLGHKHKSPSAGLSICPQCREAYPAPDGRRCLACQGFVLYA